MSRITDRMLSEAYGERQLTIDISDFTLKVGDRVTGPALPDRRSWWQRVAPAWLGGKAAPRTLDATITVISTGVQ